MKDPAVTVEAALIEAGWDTEDIPTAIATTKDILSCGSDDSLDEAQKYSGLAPDVLCDMMK